MRPNRTRNKTSYQSLENRKLLATDFGMIATPYEAIPMQFGDVVEMQELSLDDFGVEQMMVGDFEMKQMFPIEEAFFGSSLQGDFFATMDMPGLSMAFESATEMPGMYFGSSLEFGFSSQMFGEPAITQSMNIFQGWGEAEEFFGEIDPFGGFEFSEGFGAGFFEGIFGDSGFDFEFDFDFEDDELDDVEPVVLEEGFLDVSDGSDGVFGTLDTENTEETYSFFAAVDGTASIVLATNLDDGDLDVALTDSAGNSIEPTETDADSGFSKWTYDIQQGEVYSLKVSGEEGVSADYQLTVSVDAADPVDEHADEVGEDATVLEFDGGFAEVLSQLESDGDRDVFQFVAPASGDVVLQASDLGIDSDINLLVTVFDSNGEEVVSGSTNASVSLEFEVAEGETSYIAVSAAEGQTGSYYVAVLGDSFFPVDEVEDDSVIDDETGETGDEGIVVNEDEFEVGDDVEIIDVDADDLDEVEAEDDVAVIDDDNVGNEGEGVVVGDDMSGLNENEGENGIAISEGEIDFEGEDVIIVDVEELDEIDGEIAEAIKEDFESLGENEFVVMSVDEMDDMTLPRFSERFFDFDAWKQMEPKQSGDSSDSESQESDMPQTATEMVLMGELSSTLTRIPMFAEVVEIDLADLDQPDLDDFFSTNWFEQEFNWI